MENSMEVSQKIKNRTTTVSSNSPSGYLSEENENTNSKRYIHSNVDNSTVYNSQDMETTQVPITDDWLKKWYIHTMEYFSAIKRMKYCHLLQCWLS